MADTSISNLTLTTPATAAHRIPIAITPFGSGNNGYITPALILSYGTSPVAGTTGTFTGNIAAGATGGFALFSNTAGAGPSITAGTAASAVSALSLTQTWNYATAAIDGVLWTFTDTSSHANTNAFRIVGGSAGNVDALKLSTKGGPSASSFLTVGSGSSTNVGVAMGTWGSGYSGLWGTHTTPTAGNQRILFETSNTYVSASTAVHLQPNFGNILSATTTTVGVGSGVVLGFTTAAASGGALDTGFSRISAGVVGVGTGAAGSFAGRLKLTSTIVAATTVAALNASPTVGEISVVNDAIAVTVKGATLAAGGSAVSVVVWNGANWVGI
mgnify:CR=1 FL=1|tara:strand:+ start:1064 stop:2050 length:987 start_codon:yes stop_codon:yes gene_type:complete